MGRAAGSPTRHLHAVTTSQLWPRLSRQVSRELKSGPFHPAMCGAGTRPWMLGALPCPVSLAPGNDGRRAHAPQQHGWPHHVRGLPFARERRKGAARGDDASAACAAAGRHPGSSSSGRVCAHDAGAAISRPFAGGEGAAGRSPCTHAQQHVTAKACSHLGPVRCSAGAAPRPHHHASSCKP